LLPLETGKRKTFNQKEKRNANSDNEQIKIDQKILESQKWKLEMPNVNTSHLPRKSELVRV
jgi:hypothetical protein